MEKKTDKTVTGKHLCIRNWDNGIPDDVVLAESIVWSFLPTQMVLDGGKLVYIN